MTVRYALYFVPADDSALGEFGARLFGHWPDGRIEADTLDVPDRADRTQRVARYGFHATLKAPFHLAKNLHEEQFIDAVSEGVAGWQGVVMPGLSVSIDTDTLSLSLPNRGFEGVHARIADIAKRCVLDFETWRAPLDAAARLRRKPEQLSQRQRELLDTYGYPWVLDAFRFHMTLADRRNDVQDTAFAHAVSSHYSVLVPDPPLLDRIAVCREPAPGQPLVRIVEFGLKEA